MYIPHFASDSDKIRYSGCQKSFIEFSQYRKIGTVKAVF